MPNKKASTSNCMWVFIAIFIYLFLVIFFLILRLILNPKSNMESGAYKHQYYTVSILLFLIYLIQVSKLLFVLVMNSPVRRVRMLYSSSVYRDVNIVKLSVTLPCTEEVVCEVLVPIWVDCAFQCQLNIRVHCLYILLNWSGL